MPDFEKMYFHLFNRITDALEALEQSKVLRATEILKQAQIDGEEMYISAPEDT